MSRPKRIPADKVSFGEALYWARNERRHTVRQLAVALKISPTYVVDLEHDRRPPTRVSEIAKVLNIDETDLQERAGCTVELRDWLSRHPEIIRLLQRIRRGRTTPLVLKGPK